MSGAAIGTRIFRAACLEAELYEEVEHDPGATVQAFVVVVLASVACGIGSLGNGGVGSVAAQTGAALIAWLGWAAVTLLIGTRLLPGEHTESDMGELLRTLGFSSAPGLLSIFAVIPPIAGPVFLIIGAWMLVAMVIAVRQALDYCGTGRAIAVCLVGFPIYAVLISLSLLLLGPWPL